MADKTTNGEAEQRPAPQKLLLDFLQEKGLDFYVRKQQVRYLEDNGILIEPPQLIVYYKDQVEKAKAKIDLPKEK